MPAPAPPISLDPALREPGPLSKTVRPAETPWPERQRLMRANEQRTIDQGQMRTDLAAFEAMLDLWFVPRTDQQRAAAQIRTQHVAILQRLAPYSVASTAGGIAYIGERIWFCTRPPGEQWPCDPYFRPPPSDPSKPVVELVVEDGVTRLIVRDLASADDPAWAALDLGALAAARGIVLDLRGAAGSDPRPLVPWVERVTGRSMTGALREIRRAAALDPYVEAYRARYLDDTRDAAVWRTLVGKPVATGKPTTIPIAVLVDRQCQAACELVARVLQTYAGASVIGAVGKTGRLARDEAAQLVLPHSQITVYFHATEYLLAPQIEAATGSTHEWYLRQRDLDDGEAYAVREVKRRAAAPAAWPPRCDARPVATKAQLPPAARAKIHGESHLQHCGSPATVSITIHAKLPFTTMRRLVASCPFRAHVSTYAPGAFSLGTSAGFPLLSVLAQSDLVDAIRIGCEHPPTID